MDAVPVGICRFPIPHGVVEKTPYDTKPLNRNKQRQKV